VGLHIKSDSFEHQLFKAEHSTLSEGLSRLEMSGGIREAGMGAELTFR
jgi:hypothetical protein